jgi:hypothetical protein
MGREKNGIDIFWSFHRKKLRKLLVMNNLDFGPRSAHMMNVSGRAKKHDYHRKPLIWGCFEKLEHLRVALKYTYMDHIFAYLTKGRRAARVSRQLCP